MMSGEMPVSGPDTMPDGGSWLPLLGKPGAHTPSFLQQTYQCFSIAALAVASYFFISHFLVQTVTVVGRSMAPTLADSQTYILNRWVYYLRAPQKADIVVLRDPIDNGFAVKRVIAVEGDLVYLKDGKVYVNGRKIEEPYLPEGVQTFTFSTAKEELFKCGRHQYFVLGDNRMNSTDSRMFGPVSRASLLGTIMH